MNYFGDSVIMSIFAPANRRRGASKEANRVLVMQKRFLDIFL